MRILALSVLCLLALSQPADAAPVAAVLATLGTAFKAAITIKALAATALRALVKVGISLLISKLTQSKQRQPGLQTTHTTTGGTDPQGTVIGLYATAGHLVYHNSHGSHHRYLTHIVEVGDLPGVTLSRVIIDGEYSDLGTVEHANFGRPILSKDSGSTHRAWIRFMDGTQAAADPYLMQVYGNDAERPWTMNHILTGLTYAILTFDRLDKVYPQGRPQYRFELNGPRFYDLRLDSSAGGSGAHRWDDPTTWAPTQNAMVIAYTILRGITLPCGSVWGGGYPAEDLPVAHWMQAMQDCDLGVGATSRPQFQIGFEIRFEEEPADVLEELFSSANAEIFELGGYWYPNVGAASASVVDITDDDLLVSETWQFNPFPRVDQTFNAVTISHPSPNALWNPATLETITNELWEIDDGGERLFDLKLPMVSSPEQCRQIGQSLLKENRRFRSHKVPLPPEYFFLQPMNSLRWTSDWNGYSAKTFQLSEVAYDLRTLNVSVSFRENDPADFDPDLTLELPDIARVTTPVDVTDDGVPGFAIYGVAVQDAAGVDRDAAIRATWSDSLEGVADGVSFEARITGTTENYLSASTTDLALGELLLMPVLPGQDYEVHAKAIASSRETTWSIWLPVTTPDVRLSPADLSDQLQADIAVGATVRDAHNALIEGFTGTNLGQLEIDYLATQEEADAAAGFAADAEISEINAALSELGSEDARAIAVSAKDTAVAVSSQGVGVLSSQFMPGDWLAWGTGPTRTANEIYATGQTFAWDVVSGVNAGAQLQSDSAAWVGSKGAAAYRVEVEFELLTGSADGACVLFDWRNTSNALSRATKLLADMVSEPITTGQIMLASWVFERPSGFTGVFDHHSVFLLANWNNITPNADKHIKIHRAQIQPLTITDAGVLDQASAIADLVGNASAGYLIKAQAGNEVSLLDLVAADGSDGTVSVARLAADTILLDGTVRTAHMLVDSSLEILEGGAFSYGKTSAGDTINDGLYMGRDTDFGGNPGFGFIAGRIDDNGDEQRISISKDSGLTLKNAVFTIGASTATGAVYTTSQNVALTVDSVFGLLLVGAGGGPGPNGNGSGGGSNGGSTVVVLRDGVTVIQTWTAAGGQKGANSVHTGEIGPYSPYGNGLDGADGEQNHDTNIASGKGGKAGKSTSVIDYDLAGLTSPNIEITFNTGGANNGKVDVLEAGGADVRAGPISATSTAQGTITTQGTGTWVDFPTLYPRTGYWIINNVKDDVTIDFGDGTTRLFAEGNWTWSLAFISNGTPRIKCNARTVQYTYWPIGADQASA
ncbi:phage tail protein [Parasedimentitalea psychrophila]|uniref:Phage tail protein n=1 Tax=Parasedimentitalea psychrophila TaxID=2997337 RepID=A0A9Y2KXQ5_9RHOB|nr:phage tail protein [Parasedimentitalea psychrophila]WIY25070.1 phage tail protein [Parasedimentitalea psychrophila]